MDTRQQMEQVSIARRQDAIVAKDRLKEQSKQRLMKIISTKHRTTLIGSLSRFEEFIGKMLWGHGKPDDELTPEQLQWKEMWLQCRTEILNNGNNQLRALEKEIVQYDVEWLRYRVMLPVRSPNNLKEDSSK